MKPKEYVKRYNLKNTKDFSHNNIVFDLSNDFTSMVYFIQSSTCFNYARFKVCIKDMKAKFDSIKNQSIADNEVWDKLWKYFYATVIVKVRDDLFGEYLAEKKKEKDRFENNWQSGFYERLYEHLFKGSLFFTEKPVEEFSLLELDIDSDEETIKKKFRELAKIHHPDKGGKQSFFTSILEAKNKCLIYAKRLCRGSG